MIGVTRPELNPHHWQGEILLSDFKRKVVLCGRQSGKTTTIKTIVYNQALSLANQEILVLCPTHGMVKELLWRAFTRADDPLFDPALVTDQNNQDMTITLFTGSRITFKGAENIMALLGREVDLLVLDEFQSMREELWTFVEPLLATRSGTAVFTGTARHANHIMEFYRRGQSPDFPHWKSWKIRTQDSGSPAGNPENIQLAKESMSEEEFLQEYCAEPALREGLVYPGFSDANIFEDMSFIPPNAPLLLGWDFNVACMAVTVSVKLGNNMYVIDEIVQTFDTANTTTAIREVRAKYGNRRMIVYPDASGRNRSSSSIDVNNTNHQLLRTAGFNLVFDHSGNPSIEDRIIILNGLIQPMEGEPSFFVHKSCTRTIDGLSKRTYKGDKPDKTSGHDHTCDCIEYTIWHHFANRNGFTQKGIYGAPNKTPLAQMVSGTA